MITVTRKYSFCYGHRLPGYDGKCANFHGHNAEVEVEIGGEDQNSYQTMVIDFSKLKAIVNGLLLEIDHKDLTEFFNHPVDEADPSQGMVEVPATAEVICKWLVNHIKAALPDGCWLFRLRVTETPDSWAEYKANVSIQEMLRTDPYLRQALADFIDGRIR